MAEKLVSVAKRGIAWDVKPYMTRQILQPYFYTKEPIYKLQRVLAPRYMDRDGGYVRILHAGRRLGDAAQMCIIEFVDNDHPVQLVRPDFVRRKLTKDEKETLQRIKLQPQQTAINSDQQKEGEPQTQEDQPKKTGRFSSMFKSFTSFSKTSQKDDVKPPHSKGICTFLHSRSLNRKVELR